MNQSGIIPVEYKILIEPEQIDEKTSSGIYIPQQTKEKDEMAQVKGILVAVGGNAFDDWAEPIPKVGDRVYFGKYAGFVIKGEKDEKTYRLANDKDIASIIE